MPQMMPLNWIFSFFMFINIFIMFNMMNYFLFKTYNPTNYIKNFYNKPLIWKW